MADGKSTRRNLLKTAAIATGAAVGAAVPGAAHADPGTPPGHSGEDLLLFNGRIYTVDAHDSVTTSVLIRDGRFVAVGDNAASQANHPRTINLRGKAVIPGIIDAHNHIVLVGNRPGYHVPLEDAYSLDDIYRLYQERRKVVPPGQFITTIGDVSPMHIFPEHRLPTLAELDAAIPDRPVYINPASGASTTNSLGKAFFESAPLPATVAADGTIPTGAAGQGRAVLALRQAFLTPESRERGALDALQHYVRLGTTTHLDQGAFQASNTPADGIAYEDNYTMYDPFLALHDKGLMPARLRFNYLHQDTDPSAPLWTKRLQNAFKFFGDDMMRSGAAGEFLSDPYQGGPAFIAAATKVAQAGWRAEVHSLTVSDFQSQIQSFEQVNAIAPITDLRWVIAHAPFITADYVARLKALGGGLVLRGSGYISAQNGPPFRMVLDSGIHLGLHSDGGDIAPINPWIHLYYAVTGKNALGTVMIPGQQITRAEALRLFTAANKWFLQEDDLGSIEAGNHADLVVLDNDYFTVDEEQIKHISPVLTMVAGEIVHDTGELTGHPK